MPSNIKSLWVFGYGSLLWAPGFDFTDSVEGVIRGYSRKFWQGNVTHRGTPSQPGRVATLVDDPHADVWGVAYELCGEDAVTYLNNREVTLGGYVTKFTKFYPQEGGDPFSVLLYIATSDSIHWLGRAPEEKIAEQIVASSGMNGHNVEYLIRLAEYVRTHAPGVIDIHLFTLEGHVRRMVSDKNLNIQSLVGPPIDKVKPLPPPTTELSPILPFNFLDLLEPTKMRCLGI